MMESKVCTSCKTEKPLSEFHRFGGSGTQVGKWCEACYTKNKAAKKAPPPKQVHSQQD